MRANTTLHYGFGERAIVLAKHEHHMQQLTGAPRDQDQEPSDAKGTTPHRGAGDGYLGVRAGGSLHHLYRASDLVRTVFPHHSVFFFS